MRMPVKIQGSVAGISTLRIISSRVAPISASARVRSRSTLCTPSSVALSTRKNTVMATSATFDSMPMPNTMMNSGARAIFGIA
jgi:hypothetical protein